MTDKFFDKLGRLIVLGITAIGFFYTLIFISGSIVYLYNKIIEIWEIGNNINWYVVSETGIKSGDWIALLFATVWIIGMIAMGFYLFYDFSDMKKEKWDE